MFGAFAISRSSKNLSKLMSVVNCDCNNEKNTGEVRIQEYIFQSNAVSF